MDFVFDQMAENRVVKCLTIVDDATHELVAIAPERAIGCSVPIRILEELRSNRGRRA